LVLVDADGDILVVLRSAVIDLDLGCSALPMTTRPFRRPGEAGADSGGGCTARLLLRRPGDEDPNGGGGGAMPLLLSFCRNRPGEAATCRDDLGDFGDADAVPTLLLSRPGEAGDCCG